MYARKERALACFISQPGDVIAGPNAGLLKGAAWHFGDIIIIWCGRQTGRQPLITPDIEQDLYEYITSKTFSQQCLLHVIGGIDTHIHLVVSIPPKLAVSDFVGLIKGSSSHHVEHHLPRLESKFGWQRGYGSLTFGRKQLETVVQYALKQKQHHQ